MEKYIESTILSVVSQHYPNLEYIIIDGGSSDTTLEIIERYRKYITLVITEHDNGMYDAIARGFAASTGEIMAWLNADDIYLPATLFTIAQIFSENAEIQWLCGMPAFLNSAGQLVQISNYPCAKTRKDIANGWFRKEIYNYLQQEGMFWRKSLYEKSGGLNQNYHYAGDFELWMRFALHAELVTAAMPFAAFRRRADSISIDCNRLYIKDIGTAIADKRKFPNLIWKIMPKNWFFIFAARLLTLRKSKLCYYLFENNKFIVKNVVHSVSYYTLSHLLDEYKFRK
jgi:glycosyltransferase involved in cell wall biosynthesis